MISLEQGLNVKSLVLSEPQLQGLPLKPFEFRNFLSKGDIEGVFDDIWYFRERREEIEISNVTYLNWRDFLTNMRAAKVCLEQEAAANGIFNPQEIKVDQETLLEEVEPLKESFGLNMGNVDLRSKLVDLLSYGVEVYGIGFRNEAKRGIDKDFLKHFPICFSLLFPGEVNEYEFGYGTNDLEEKRDDIMHNLTHGPASLAIVQLYSYRLQHPEDFDLVKPTPVEWAKLEGFIRDSLEEKLPRGQNPTWRVTLGNAALLKMIENGFMIEEDGIHLNPPAVVANLTQISQLPLRRNF